jgi:hypothetical protein
MLLGIVCLLLSCGKEQKNVGSLSTDDKKSPEAEREQKANDSIVADFRYFIHLLETTHPDPFSSYGGKVFFHRAASEIVRSLKDDNVTTKEELSWRIQEFLAPLSDGHTQILNPELPGSPTRVPIRFKAVGDGLIVSRLPKEQQPLIGSRLIGIENIQTADLCEEMMKIYPAENDIGKLVNICWHGHQPVVLGRIIPHLRQDTITYRLLTPEGNSIRLPLPIIPVEQWEEWKNEKVTASASSLAGDTIFPKENLGYSFSDKQKNIMYFRSTSIMARDNFDYMYQAGKEIHDDLKSCYDEVYHRPMPSNIRKAIAGLPSFSEEFEKMLLQMKLNNSENLIVDLRGNSGGWTPIALPTLYQLWGDGYLQKNFQDYTCRLLSPLYMKKLNLTIEEFNAQYGTDYELGDYIFSESDEKSQTVTEEIRTGFINNSMSCIQDHLAKQNGRPVFTPKHVYVLADAETFSAGFHYMFYLWKMGAKIVGVPSCQAPNTFMEVTSFILPRTQLKGTISNSIQQFLPADDPRSKQLTPDIQLNYDDYKRYHFDSQAEILYLLDYIK